MIGQSDTMSPSVSIVAEAGHQLWPCGRHGFICVKEIERRAVAQWDYSGLIECV